MNADIMSDRFAAANSIGLVPLVLGSWYVATTFRSALGNGQGLGANQLGAIAGVLGGAASVVLGIGILLGIGEFESPSEPNRRTLIGLCAVAGLLFVAGVSVQAGV